MQADAARNGRFAAWPAWNTLLRALREARGIARDGWAARRGCSGKTVQRWEQGQLVPDAAAEAALCGPLSELGLFRHFDAGPLSGLDLSAQTLGDLRAAARLDGGSPSLTPPVSDAVAQPEVTPAPAANLPPPLTSFVGREAELVEVQRLLAVSRLLTLTRRGGTDKTRLALAAAARVASACADGVWFVDLSPVSDPAAVVPAIAQVLRVTETEGQSLPVSLGAYLRIKRLRLVLDNVEQVVSAAPLLRDLLAAAPARYLLVTSRVQLHIGGERVYSVPPLPVPDAGQPAGLEALGDNPAVRLFVKRTRALRPDFARARRMRP